MTNNIYGLKHAPRLPALPALGLPISTVKYPATSAIVASLGRWFLGHFCARNTTTIIQHPQQHAQRVAAGCGSFPYIGPCGLKARSISLGVNLYRTSLLTP